MIVFETLDVREANAFVELSIREFLAEQVSTAQLTHARVATMKDQLRQRLLPDGIDTTGHRFEAILSDGVCVGRVWFGPLMDSDPDLYVCDINIDVERRREGHARATIELIVDQARHGGASRVGLSVAHTNTAAIALYESLGFVTTSSDDTQREMWTTVDTRAT